MIKNLPRTITKQILLDDLSSTGFGALLDFFYLPMCLVNQSNRGHAFINFAAPGIALKFKREYDGRRIGEIVSGKIIKVLAAEVQGFASNYACHSGKVVHPDKDDRAAPVFFRTLQPTEAAWLGELRIPIHPPPNRECKRLPRTCPKNRQTVALSTEKSEAKVSTLQCCPYCACQLPIMFKDPTVPAEIVQPQFCHNCGRKLPPVMVR